MLNLKLKVVKPAVPSFQGLNPFTKQPCEFSAQPAKYTVTTFVTKKFTEMV